MTLALHADHVAAFGDHLRDVRAAALRALGDPEHGTDAELARQRGEGANSRMGEREQLLGKPGRIHGAAERHLGEHRQRASGGMRLPHHPFVLAEVLPDSTLLARQRREHHPHRVSQAPNTYADDLELEDHPWR